MLQTDVFPFCTSTSHSQPLHNASVSERNAQKGTTSEMFIYCERYLLNVCSCKFSAFVFRSTTQVVILISRTITNPCWISLGEEYPRSLFRKKHLQTRVQKLWNSSICEQYCIGTVTSIKFCEHFENWTDQNVFSVKLTPQVS